MTDQDLIDLHTIYAATTPGLWHVEGHDGSCLAYTVSTENGNSIIGSVRGSHSERAANARFIAAMHTAWPDLLTELQVYRQVVRENAADATALCKVLTRIAGAVPDSKDTLS